MQFIINKFKALSYCIKIIPNYEFKRWNYILLIYYVLAFCQFTFTWKQLHLSGCNIYFNSFFKTQNYFGFRIII